jgi:hypothetical protein
MARQRWHAGKARSDYEGDAVADPCGGRTMAHLEFEQGWLSLDAAGRFVERAGGKGFVDSRRASAGRRRFSACR